MDDALLSILEAMEVATRLIERLETELIATREANMVLTAEIVRLENLATGLLAQVDQLEARITRRNP